MSSYFLVRITGEPIRILKFETLFRNFYSVKFDFPKMNINSNIQYNEHTLGNHGIAYGIDTNLYSDMVSASGGRLIIIIIE